MNISENDIITLFEGNYEIIEILENKQEISKGVSAFDFKVQGKLVRNRKGNYLLHYYENEYIKFLRIFDIYRNESSGQYARKEKFAKIKEPTLDVSLPKENEIFIYKGRGITQDFKSYEKLYLKGYDYGYYSVVVGKKFDEKKGKFVQIRENMSFAMRLKNTTIEERLELLYRRFKFFESYYYSESAKAELLKTIKTSTYRVRNIQQIKYSEDEIIKINGTLPMVSIYAFVNNDVIGNEITYHKHFVELKKRNFSIENTKDYINSLELDKDNWKIKKMRKDTDGFIVYKDSIIIWNKFGEKKNGNAFISKLIFTNKE